MNTYWFTAIFIVWYTVSLIIAERIGKKRAIGEEWSFFLSFMLSPLVGLVASLASKPREQNQA